MLKFRLNGHKTKDILLNLSIPINTYYPIDLVGANPYISSTEYFDEDTQKLLKYITKYDCLNDIDITKDSILCLDKQNLCLFVLDWSKKCKFNMMDNYTITDWLQDYLIGLKYISANSKDNTLYRNVFFNQREMKLYQKLNTDILLDTDISLDNTVDIIPNNVLPEYSWMAVDYILNNNYSEWITKRLEENIYTIEEAKKQFSYGFIDILNIPKYNNCNSITDFFYFCCPLLDDKVLTNYRYIYKALCLKLKGKTNGF